MALVFDIILVGIFLWCVYKGAKNGFVRSVASLLASVVALCAALFVVMQVSPVLSSNVVTPWIAGKLQTQLEESMGESALETVDSLLETADKIFTSLQELVDEEAEEVIKTEEVAEDLVGSVSQAIGDAGTAVLLFVVLFALFLAILRVLIDQLRFINKIPIVGTANALLGMALGAVTGAIFLIIPVWLLLSFVPSIFHMDVAVAPELLEQSKVLSIVMQFYRG